MAFLTEYWSKGRPQYTPSETAFHDVSSEVYCGLLVFANVSNTERHAISIHNGVLGGRSTPCSSWVCYVLVIALLDLLYK